MSGNLSGKRSRGPQKGVAMASEEHPNAKLVREGFQAFERGDMEWMGQHLADDIVWHVGGNSKWAGSYEGKE